MKIKNSHALTILFILSIWPLLPSLLTQGVVCCTWDWDSPPFNEQITNKASSYFQIWNSDYGMGSKWALTPTAFFWWIILLFNFVEASILIKFSMIATLLLSGVSMYYLSKKFKLNNKASFLSAIIYMYSPVIYSRFVAGHLPIAFGYSVIPLFIIFFLKANEEKLIKNSIIAGFLFTLSSIHPMLLVVSLILLFIFSLYELLNYKNMKPIYTSTIIIIIFSLMNSFWILPFINTLSGGIKYRGGAFEEETSIRRLYLEDRSTPIIGSLNFISETGLGPEFVFPSPFYIKAFSALTLILIMLNLLGKLDKKFYLFFILFLTGIILISGVNTIFGTIFYNFLLNNLGMVFNTFSNPNRFNPIMSISIALLVGYSVNNKKIRKISNVFFRKILKFKNSKLINAFYILLIISPIIYYSWPFVTFNLNQHQMYTDQPLCLRIVDYEPEDYQLYNWLLNQDGFFRVTYLPSTYATYVGEKTKHLTEFTTLYSPKPEFLSSFFVINNPSRFIFSIIYNQDELRTRNIHNLLKIANVKYVIVPDYDEFYYYPFDYNFTSKSAVPWLQVNKKPELDSFLASQDGLNKLDLFDTFNVFEINITPKMIYQTRNAYLLSGYLNGLISLDYLNFNIHNKAILLNDFKQNNENTKLIVINNDNITYQFSKLNDGYKILPGKLVLSNLDPLTEWANINYHWPFNYYYSSYPKQGNGMFSLTNSSITKEFEINQGEYTVYTLIYKGYQSSLVEIKINDFNKEIITKTDKEKGLVWEKLFDITLNDFNNITIKSEEGENAVFEIVFLPKNYEFKNELDELFVNEGEFFNPKIKDINASNHYTARAPLNYNFYASCDSVKRLIFRARCNNSKLKVNNQDYDVGGNYELRETEFHIKKGMNNINFTSDGDCYVDVFGLLDNDDEIYTIPYQELSNTEFEFSTNKIGYLIFNQNFHDGWISNADFNKQISISGNSFYVNKTGEFKIYFEDQIYYSIGLSILLITIIVGSLLILIMELFIKERNHK